MRLVVGLGNPGREHEGQRHNLGFVVAEAWRQAEGLPPLEPKFRGLFARGTVGGEPTAVLLPQTYMNLSGESVQPACAFFKVEPRDVLVVHDELDLAWKDVRLKMGGGHAGHNGLRSLVQHLGPDFARLRVGIGKPPPGRETHGWVLGQLDPVERAELPEVVAKGVDAIRRVLADGIGPAMNVVNTRGTGA